MGGFLGTLWWVVLFFCLFCVNIWGMRCFKNRCYCKEELRLIDCSRVNLMVVPNSVPLVNYTALNLRHNSLVQVNFSVLREQLPNLKMVDLRDNPFACKGFPDKTIFGVITDCEMAMTRKTLKTTRLPSSHAGTPTRKLYCSSYPKVYCDWLTECQGLRGFQTNNIVHMVSRLFRLVHNFRACGESAGFKRCEDFKRYKGFKRCKDFKR